MIDSCYTNVLDAMYGGVELAENVAYRQREASAEEPLNTVPSSTAIRLLSGRHLEESENQAESATSVGALSEVDA